MSEAADSYVAPWQIAAEIGGEVITRRLPRSPYRMQPDGRYETCAPGTLGIICDRLRAGEPLTRICRDPGMPSYPTISRWREVDAPLALALREARRASAEALADMAIEVAEAATPETAAADRVRVDTYRWAASKYRPDVYGDRTTHAHTGADGGPVQVQHTVVDDARAVAFLLARAQAVDAVQIEGSTPTAAVDSEP